MSRVRVSVRPRIFYTRKKPKPIVNTESPACCLFRMQMSLHDGTENLPERSQFYSDHRVHLSTNRYCQSATFGPLAFCDCLFFYDIKKIPKIHREDRPPRKCTLNEHASDPWSGNAGHGRSIASDDMSGDTSDHSGDRLSEPKRRKATSQNGDNESVYLHGLKNVVYELLRSLCVCIVCEK